MVLWFTFYFHIHLRVFQKFWCPYLRCIHLRKSILSSYILVALFWHFTYDLLVKDVVFQRAKFQLSLTELGFLILFWHLLNIWVLFEWCISKCPGASHLHPKNI